MAAGGTNEKFNIVEFVGNGLVNDGFQCMRYVVLEVSQSNMILPCNLLMLVWRKGNIENNCLCVTVLCTIIMVHSGTSSSYRSVDCIGL